MAEETTIPVSDAAPADSGETLTPDNASADSGEDVGALKRAYERTKQELKEAKTLARRAAILDELEAGGIRAEDLPKKLAEIKSAEEQEQRLAQMRVEWESAAEAEKRELQQRFNAQVSSLNEALRSQIGTSTLNDIFLAGGGSAKNEVDANDFRSLVQRHVEIEYLPDKNDNGEVIGYKAQVKGFKAPDGTQLWIADEKEAGKSRPATMQDFIGKVKEGKYGTALQTLLPAYNLSSGSDIPGVGGASSGGVIRLNRGQAIADYMATLSPAQLAQVKSGEIKIMVADE